MARRSPGCLSRRRSTRCPPPPRPCRLRYHLARRGTGEPRPDAITGRWPQAISGDRQYPAGRLLSVLAEQKARNDDADPFTFLVVTWPAHRCAGERGEAAASGVGAWWTAGHARSRCPGRLARRVAWYVAARLPLCHSCRHLDRRAWHSAPAPANHLVLHPAAHQEPCALQT